MLLPFAIHLPFISKSHVPSYLSNRCGTKYVIYIRKRAEKQKDKSFPFFSLPAQMNSLKYGQLLQSIGNTVPKGQQLHAHIITSGALHSNTYLSTKLCAMYAFNGRMAEARVVFDSIVLKNPFLWNVMIRGFASSGLPVTSLGFYRDMVRLGTGGDNFSYPFVLMACRDLSLADAGRRVHCQLVVGGYESDLFVGNSLMSMYSNFGEMGVARTLFDRMLTRDATSWNTIISGLAKNGFPQETLSVFAGMVKCGERLDLATLLGVLPACADLAAAVQGKEIHAYILRRNMESNGFLMNALLDVYVNCKFVTSAKRLFDKMSERDTVAWNSMISGLARHGDAIQSLTCFIQMNLEGLVPDAITLIAVLGACDRISALQFGESLHVYLIKMGLDKRVDVGTALLDMYAKCGSLNCSRQVFHDMPIKNLISWSAMVSGYGLHGKGREAVECYHELKKNGIRPDKITFTSVLSACSHSGLVHEGKEIFHEMSNKYSLRPSVEHCACMVDLLGRAGRLDEAYEFVKNMEIEPNVDVWAALLSACRIYHNVELAEVAARNAFHLKPKSIGVYVSLSNIYAKEKRWGDVERVRTAARWNGLRKQAGCSYVKLDKTIHRFMVGDKSHPHSRSIYTKLDELRKQTKEAGYVPDTGSVLYDVEDDVKENMLWDHSERLAIAFALLNTCHGMSIRITKNLRVCGDCHAVTKLISKIVGREIVMRDARRFHHFLDGSCSCGDFW